MELFIRGGENGKEGFDLGMVKCDGLTGQFTKESGKITGHMEKVHFCIWTGIFTKGNGHMIKQMGMENILIAMERHMKDIGRMMYSMEMEKKHGLIMQNMKENILTEKSMA